MTDATLYRDPDTSIHRAVPSPSKADTRCPHGSIAVKIECVCGESLAWDAFDCKVCGRRYTYRLEDGLCELVRRTAPGEYEYRGWHIHREPPPIPSRAHDVQFWHDEYTGPGDSRRGTAPTLAAALGRIAEMEAGDE